MSLSPEHIRAAKAESRLRDRDLAAELGISEAQLVAAHIGHGAQRIMAHPDQVMPQISRLGEVMALTRNESAVHERVGVFGEYRSGAHAAMVIGEDIDTRIFPKHWVYGFALEQDTEKGPRRSLQFFDAAGDAVQKIFMRLGSDHGAWADVLAALAVEDQAQSQEQSLTVEPRAPTEPAKSRAENRDTLLSEWARMTDTHQFNRLCAKLGMNRLGAYRLVADTKWVTPMDVSAPAKMLEAVSLRGQEVILFVGNRGNIQIHWGKMEVITPMGPWLNVMDERFNLHLRGDHIAEVYVVEKPTKRGPAISLEAFDAEGGLIFQVFGRRAGQEDDNSSWHTLLSSLPLKLGVPA